MPITYKVLKCKNPRGASGTLYAADRAVKTGDYDFDALAEDIQLSTTVTKADVIAVLTAAQEYIMRGLLAGQRVILKELGSLQIQLKGKCFQQSAISGADFNPASYIDTVNIRFRPDSKLIKHIRADVSVKRLSSSLMP